MSVAEIKHRPLYFVHAQDISQTLRNPDEIHELPEFKELLEDAKGYLQSVTRGKDIQRRFEKEGKISGNLEDLEAHEDSVRFAKRKKIEPELLHETVISSVKFIAGEIDEEEDVPNRQQLELTSEYFEYVSEISYNKLSALLSTS